MRPSTILAMLLVVCAAALGLARDAAAEATHGEPDDAPWARLAGIYQYVQLDFLDSADALGYSLEAETQFSFPWFDIENRIVLDFLDYPAEIQDPQGNPFFINGAGSGLGDTLVGTFFSLKEHKGPIHIGFGPVLMAPTATDDNLGSGKWTLGPGIHVQGHFGKLDAGLFLWNSWSFAGDSDRKSVNQMTAKPYVIYELTERWSLLYIPLGISASWDKPRKDRWKIPLGGGAGYKFNLGQQPLEFQAQAFYSVARPESAAEWSLRFTLEIPL